MCYAIKSNAPAEGAPVVGAPTSEQVSGCDRKLENFADKAANKADNKTQEGRQRRRGGVWKGEGREGEEGGWRGLESEKRDEPQKQTGANRNIMFQQRSHIKNDTPIKFNNLKMKQQRESERCC